MPIIRFAQHNYSVVEGDSGTKFVRIKVVLSEPSTSTVTVKFDTGTHSGAIERADFGGVHRVLTFAPGQTETTVKVPIIGDTVNEAYETFVGHLSAASGGAQLDVDETAHYTYVGITDNDPALLPIIRFAQHNYSVVEGDSGTKFVRIKVVLSEPSTSTVTVKFDTGTHSGAIERADFGGVHRVLTFAPGQTETTVKVPIIGDTVNEAYETFVGHLSAASGGAQLDVDENAHYTYVGITDNDPLSAPPALHDLLLTL